VRTTRFWKNLHQVRNIRMPNNLKLFGSNIPKPKT